MQKILLTFILFACLSLSAQAQRIVVDKTDSSKEAVDLANFQRITFSDSQVNIKQADAIVITNEMSEIARIYFDDYTKIENAEINDNKNLVTYISSGEIAVNCQAGEIITIYSVSGSTILNQKQSVENGSLNIAHLTKGIYLLQAKGQTVKIIKK